MSYVVLSEPAWTRQTGDALHIWVLLSESLYCYARVIREAFARGHCRACSNAPMPFINACVLTLNPSPAADIYASFFSTAGATRRSSSSTLGVLQRRRSSRVRHRRALRTPTLLPSPPW